MLLSPLTLEQEQSQVKLARSGLSDDLYVNKIASL